MTNTKQPLYKQLNEQRTQGEWYQFADTIQTEDGKIMDVCTENKAVKNKWEANAKYTCLAVNNLHHLAEVLDKIVGSMALERVERFDLLEQAKEALNRIS